MDIYWTEERAKNLSRAYGAKGWPWHLIEDKFHPAGSAKDVLKAAYDSGREWANKRKRSVLSAMWRAM